MRATLGAGLLLVSTTLVGLVATPAEAASVCDDGSADTTWVGPATPDGSASWDEPTNWTNGVPTAASTVCIPDTSTGPSVVAGTQAVAGAVALNGTLTVETSLDVASLEGDFGELRGPGTTRVSGSLSGYWLTFRDAAVVDLQQQATLGGELHVYDGSRLNVRGDTVLQPDARIDSLSGLLTITPTGSLTFDSADQSADVIGGFANHGEVIVTAGFVFMQGASPEDAHPDQFSTGTFTGAPEATFNVSSTELRDGARLDHVTWVDHITVPDGSKVTVADSGIVDFPNSNEPPPPSILGAGEIVATDGTRFDFVSVGGATTITIPQGEVVRMGDVVVQDQARVRVVGELAQSGDINLEDGAVLDVYGTHRAAQGGMVGYSGTDPGVEIVQPGGRLLSDPEGGLTIVAPFVNQGTVDSGTGWIYVGPSAESPSASSGTFRADPAGTLLLGSNVDGAPPLALHLAAIEGAVDVSGLVTARYTDVRGKLSTLPGGRLVLDDTTSVADGTAIAGDVTVRGQLQADLGPTGTASLSGAEVPGDIVAISGTLSVPSLALTTLDESGTLAQGQWTVWPGATLDLPEVTTIDAGLLLGGPGASFGDGLANLAGIGPKGYLLSGGVDLAVPGPFRNQGLLGLIHGARLDVSGQFQQLSTGTLYTYLDSTGRGRVRAVGPRDLAGKLWIDRDPAYKPPIGTVLPFITSTGASSADDVFDKVVSPRYGTRKKINPVYGVNRVRLRVERLSTPALVPAQEPELAPGAGSIDPRRLMSLRSTTPVSQD